MKTKFLPMLFAAFVSTNALAQSPQKTDPVIEGGKFIVELVKAIGGKKAQEKDHGCKGVYADLCVENSSSQSITVYLEHRASLDKCEVIVLPDGRECCLRAQVGVWTFDLKTTGSLVSIRKGDLLIEGCINMEMHIK